MKKIFEPQELVQAWLTQSQYGGKTKGGNFYFSGATIYSYGTHFPIAILADAPNGEKVIFLTTLEYSMTTGKHVSRVRNGIRNTHYRVVECRDPTEVVGEHNVAAMKFALDTLQVKHAKARKPELYAGQILDIAKRCRVYCEVKQLPVPLWAELPVGIAPGKPLVAALRLYGADSSGRWFR